MGQLLAGAVLYEIMIKPVLPLEKQHLKYRELTRPRRAA